MNRKKEQRDIRTISIIHGNQTTDILIIIRVGQYSLEVATGTKRGQNRDAAVVATNNMVKGAHACKPI